MRLLAVPCALFLACCLASALHAASPAGHRAAAPTRTRVYDVSRRTDVNQINMVTPNFGWIGYDNVALPTKGFLYPNGTAMSPLYAGGLWLGATVGGEVRVAVAEYSSEYVPGSMLGGISDDPWNGEYVTWKVVRWTGAPADSGHAEWSNPPLYVDPLVHHSWSEYMRYAAPHGAPWKYHRLPVTWTGDPTDSLDVPGPDVSGDQMLWSVFNDASDWQHTAGAGGTLPLGVEIQQTTFAFQDVGPLGRVVFVRYRIINKGANSLSDARVGLWTDPDLGAYADDLAGCDTTLKLGYCYNATNADLVYGATPPALGIQILQGPVVGTGRIGAAVFQVYVNGTDPNSATETYNVLRGLRADGSVIVNPTTLQPTTWFYPGDPTTGTGWTDSSPGDRRMELVTGPFAMAPGDTQSVVVAVLIGHGSDRLDSIRRLRCAAEYVSDVFAQDFPRPLPPASPTCGVLLDCPRPASYWESECAAPEHVTPATLAGIGSDALAASAFFNPPTGPASFCGTLLAGAGGDLRAQAAREYLALLANVSAGDLNAHELSGDPIRLGRSTAIDGTCLGEATVGGLSQKGTRARQVYEGTYLDLVATHPTALAGVDAAGGPVFGGGGSTAFDFFASSLDPAAQPDSFPTVELHFDPAQPQKAYRYLWLLQANGLPPAGGRGYRYGGYFDVPFTAWDTDHGVQLEVAFTECAVTDAGGTILSRAQQPATFDSTWAPDHSSFGGREYLVVMARPYTPVPRPGFTHDGAFVDASLPGLYALWARKVDAGSVIDPGDALRFRFGLPPLPCVDQRMIRLESLPLSDPAVAQEYQDIVDCLSAINAGNRIGQVCDVPTPTQLALVSAEASPDRVFLRWYSDEPGLRASVERRTPTTAWSVLAEVVADGTGSITHTDREVVPGRRYGYRLAWAGATGTGTAGEAWVDVPLDHALGLRGLRAAGARVTVGFTLPTGAPARIELLDVAGRRVWQRTLAGLEPGDHEVEVGGAGLRSGLYFIRLEQGGRRAMLKSVLVR